MNNSLCNTEQETASWCTRHGAHVWTYPGHGPWPLVGQLCACGEETWKDARPTPEPNGKL